MDGLLNDVNFERPWSNYEITARKWCSSISTGEEWIFCFNDSNYSGHWKVIRALLKCGAQVDLQTIKLWRDYFNDSKTKKQYK